MRKAQLNALAEYLGGKNQTKFSIYLQMGGMKAGDAKEFFALRDAFQVQSYATVADAAQQISKSILPEKVK